jgi:hypothetical protein
MKPQREYVPKPYVKQVSASVLEERNKRNNARWKKIEEEQQTREEGINKAFENSEITSRERDEQLQELKNERDADNRLKQEVEDGRMTIEARD